MINNFVKIPVKTIYMKMCKNPAKGIVLPSNISFDYQSDISIDDYLEIYKRVGEKWGWSGRLIISEEELSKVLNDPDDAVYFMSVDNEVAGFFELYKHSNNVIELIYMGLIPEFIGKGLGKILLNFAIEIAWKSDIKELWLHTCEFDHCDAVKVYEKAGFVKFDEKIDEEYYPEDFLEKFDMC